MTPHNCLLKNVFIALTCALTVFMHNGAAQIQDRTLFFKTIIGGTEDAFIQDLKNSKGSDWITYTPGASSFIAKKANKQYTCGTFAQTSLAELRNITPATGPGGGSISAVVAYSPLKKTYLRFVDVGALQADSANNSAVFLVASNFNGLETTGYANNIDVGKHKLESYPNDPTQGPAASISAAPGLILRRYLLYAKNNTPMQEWAQSMTHYEKFLDQTDIGSCVPPSGYPVLSNIPHLKKPDNTQQGKIKIGWHKDIQVTFGFSDGTQHEIVPHTKHRVDQIFAAAINLDGNPNSKNDVSIAWAQTCLNAAVEGCLRAAILKFTNSNSPHRKVFLTPIGCGVFANELPWFGQAIQACKNLIITHGLQVTVIWFDRDFWRQSEENRNLFEVQLKQLISATGGSYTEYNDQNPNGRQIIAGTTTPPSLALLRLRLLALTYRIVAQSKKTTSKTVTWVQDPATPTFKFQRTSYFVAITPPENVASHLAAQAATTTKHKLHLTLAYLGSQTKENMANFITKLYEKLRTNPSLGLIYNLEIDNAKKIHKLFPGSSAVGVKLKPDTMLNALVNAIWQVADNTLEKTKYDNTTGQNINVPTAPWREFGNFVPHITLAQLPSAGETFATQELSPATQAIGPWNSSAITIFGPVDTKTANKDGRIVTFQAQEAMA